jgi:hypothetical protein
MKLQGTFIAVMMLFASSALAQVAPATGAPPKAPAHQPGVSANPPATQQKAPPSLEKPDPAKDAAIRKLMAITQTDKMGDNISAALTNQVKQVMSRAIPPDRLPKFMDDFTAAYSTAAPSSAVTDAVVPVYARHFSTEDIQALVQFYESPLGQRVVKSMPQVTQESESAGIQLDQGAAMKVLQGLQSQYPELKQMLPPENGGQPAGGAGAAPGPPPAPEPKPAPATPQK